MPQFDFIGGAYEAANPMQDAQALVNWYVELDRNEGAKTPKALLGVPGKAEAVTSTFPGEVRGAHVMPGGQTAYLVIGGQVVKMSIAAPATATSLATFSLTAVGTIGTSTGQVCMRDNGVANLCAIVDGQSMYIVNAAAGTLTKSTDPNIIKPSRLASIDGILVFNSDGTQKFNTTPPYWNGTDALDGTFFALKDDAPDQMVTMIEDRRELWLIGEATTEVWFNQGSSGSSGATEPFARLQGAMLQVGCAAKNSVARTGHGLVWLGNSERGENFVLMTQGYDYQNISNPALAYALTQYNVINDAFGYVYTEEGHEFYVLTFPTADVTWVYDFTTAHWHKRQYLDSAGAHRDRANCLINFGGQRIVGDYKNGKVYRQSRSIYVDGDAPLVSLRRTPYVWDENDRNRVHHHHLQLEFTPGVGLSIGQGSNPVLMLRWKDERGWSNERQIPIGAMGQTRNRAIARKLGASRFRIYEVSISDPVPRDVVGATLKAGGSGA